ncbi:hypothetical protein M409DRAFT_64957 [Zasmidium cellare ATCC 36951]|uniref:Ysc84 actin-binding domain-containing protein n=1 Tax=Zasmidium cellare ATCC 36951 TaxID=1080233 RepID=A0A6A6CUP8_ZASCE|nr:uncharacterized protein M409DRAFT_64957 [Zasmidium cellare ATCC 36951]KAF2169216.1 hypothetical protein M409DRAFT_64957 [Zasmidium cellare ATCC 36951]
MSNPTMWEKVKVGSKSGFDKTWKALDKLGGPVNRLSNKLGSEAFWPTTLDKESDKAARILKSFCKDGFYAEEDRYDAPQDGPKQKQKVVKKIPADVIKNAKGLAIFTTMRTGLWISGAGGSGILVARTADGSWSPPSGILLHTAGLGFLVGVDIYDCVIVMNTEEAVQAFTKVRCTLGSEISVAAGPVGAGGVMDTEVHKRQAPIFTYLKSRGFYAGVQIDGSVIIERFDENERFYGQKISVQDILAGKARHPPYEVKRLMETIKAAQGDTNFDASMIPTEAPPSDFDVEKGTFGVPDKEDPDPYGVLALEKEGMSLKEAGTKKRASWEEFTFNPAPTSPVHSIYARQSQDFAGGVRRNSWRSSAFANTEPKTPSSLRNSMDQVRSPSLMVDSATQTELNAELAAQSPHRRSMHSLNGSSRHGSQSSIDKTHLHMQNVPENDVLKTAEHANGYTTPPRTPPASHDTHDHVDDEHDEEVHIVEPATMHSVQSVQPAQQVISRAKLVDVPKRIPPKLPPRNPGRNLNAPVVVDASPKEGTSPQDASPERPISTEPETAEPTVADKLEDIKLDDDEEDEDEKGRPDPWAKVEEAKKLELEYQQLKDESGEHNAAKMPGGFD